MTLRTKDNVRLIGIGIYSIPEASALLDVQPSRLRRWLLGYRYRSKAGVESFSTALWEPQIPANNFGLHLGFRDLIEARVVNSLRVAGLGLPTIRKAISVAREFTRDLLPFSTSRFQTDGRSVFLEIASETEEPELVNLLTRQLGFHQFVSPSFKNLDYDKDGVVSRWWPLSAKRRVVIDPARSFGAPIDPDSGVSTAALFAAVAAEGSEHRAAAVFGVSIRAVRDAVAFEQKIAA